MQYIDRSQSIITGKKNLEHLHTFKDIPVFFGCVDTDPKEDVFVDASWSICPETWVVQLDKLIPLEILYQSQHVDWTGPTWDKYYKEFARYVRKWDPKSVLEIGWGMGRLAHEYLSISENNQWTIVEPNPIIKPEERIKVISGFFDDKISIGHEIDAVVFSQVLEHAYDPQEFVQNIGKFLSAGKKLIFAYPNLKFWLENKYTNAINLEHTAYLTDYFVDVLLSRSNFKILDKSYYENHSVFYVVEKAEDVTPMVFENKYDEYKKVFMDYVSYYEDMAVSLNEKVSDFDWEVYMFGAHIFSQHLISCGLSPLKIVSLLDNSKIKIWKRLYGTDLMVNSPSVVADKQKVAVILKAGIYQEEIKKQLLEINPNVVIFE